MAWTASVAAVDKTPSVIFVTVRYSDGSSFFDEIHKLYAAPDADWLKRTAAKRIGQLAGLESATIPSGTIGPWADPTDPEISKLSDALRQLERIKLLIDCSVITKADQRVVDFIALLKTKVDAYWDKL
jgi:hypothetical protein